ncbi:MULTISPECIES: response regulator [unclassified Rhizobium]|uniref:response regulator n=1 Tax=unclassified Rhizobium TaxID=2613769 RepID=UPI0007155F4E|nr:MULTISPECIES: response regulator [unclassified Rhizobium]KQT01710.1 hypothetical protein ASG42_27295 [Rhizobium sp. Leaf391]KQT06766.1 hypothetical protein ASG50_13680 [Rhizobium sp. Leaf386]KQU05946.1 hypothetical protein ASG68_24615 [Rhizobium sp. Leaf453]
MGVRFTIGVTKCNSAVIAGELTALAQLWRSRHDPAQFFIRRANTVLIVEDEPLIALDIEQTLTDAGHVCEIHTSNGDALRWLEHYTPASAILDIALKRLKRTDRALACLQKHSILDLFGLTQ